jgi:hypothetical protein
MFPKQIPAPGIVVKKKKKRETTGESDALESEYRCIEHFKSD